MKSLMETLMAEENSRNCCRRTKHQLSAVVSLSTDTTPAQGVHGSNHEGFMVPRPMLPGRFALPHRQCDRDGQNTSSRGSWFPS
jgi:hypothetical protein